jgi:hypothetical protein
MSTSRMTGVRAARARAESENSGSAVRSRQRGGAMPPRRAPLSHSARQVTLDGTVSPSGGVLQRTTASSASTNTASLPLRPTASTTRPDAATVMRSVARRRVPPEDFPSPDVTLGAGSTVGAVARSAGATLTAAQRADGPPRGKRQVVRAVRAAAERRASPLSTRTPLTRPARSTDRRATTGPRTPSRAAARG